MVNAVAIRHIEQTVPAIGLITDAALRAATVATWLEALGPTPYDRIEAVPQSPQVPHRSLLRHVNEVNDRALKLYDLCVGHYQLRPDRDLTIAAAVLHDVDKPVIYRRDDAGVFAYADGYGPSDHGPVGARLAATNGIPNEICEIIRCHSPVGSDPLPPTAEATIVRYSDVIAAELSFLECGIAPFHVRTKIVPRC